MTEATISGKDRLWPTLKRILFPQWVRNRRVKHTKAGYVFVLLMVAVAGASFNTGNNLLYILLSVMLSGLFASFLISEYIIISLEIERDAPEVVTERTPFRVTYSVKNKKKVMPTMALAIEEKLGTLDIMSLVSFAGPGTVVKAKAPAMTGKRGRVKFEDTIIRTTAPFGFFDKAKRVPLGGEVISLPRTDEVAVDLDEIQASGEERPRSKPGQGDELFGFRSYVRGDPVKDVHWKTSARSGKMMVRQREAEEERRLRLVLAVSDSGLDPSREEAVRKAASLASSALDQGWLVRIELPGGRGVDFGRGGGHLYSILMFLALFDDPKSREGTQLAPTDVESVAIGNAG